MKTFKEFMVTRGFSLGPSGVHKPMASMGGKGQHFPQHRKYSTVFATYKGPGFGTYKPMVTANQKIKNELSVKLKQKVLDRKIKRAKAKFLTKKFLSKP